MGRTNHIHFKVREGGRIVSRKETPDGRTYVEGHTSHIGQVFFPEDFAAELMRHEPMPITRYIEPRKPKMASFKTSTEPASIARLQSVDSKHPEAGYIAEMIVATDPTKTPAPVGMHRPGRPPVQPFEQ